MSEEDVHSSESAHTRVVAIGGSAGALEALRILFRSLSSPTYLAFVVIQHLPPSKPSHLVELIRRWSSLPVDETLEGERPMPGHVYVANPAYELTLERGVFRFRTPPAMGHRNGLGTIDAFFESLAEQCGPRAIAVVLSGSNDDGAAGAVSVKQRGGIVIVQDPVTAMHDGMPRAAIHAAGPHYILPTAGIGQQLVQCASRSYRPPPESALQTAEMARALESILGMLRKQAGVDLCGYKSRVLLWRIQQRMNLRRMRSFSEYELLLQVNPVELEVLVRAIPIHLTEFFRDPPAWEVLGTQVIEPLLKERKPGEPIRIWTPACASGEEAYSVAILLSEKLEQAGRARDFQVFATDASAGILARASHGVFAPEALKGLSVARRARFFDKVDGAYRVNGDLREKMVFASHDALFDPPFTKIDLVTCRNLLIYLTGEAVRRVLYTLHCSLRADGYMFLGSSEGFSPSQQGFREISTRWRIYGKAGPFSDRPTGTIPLWRRDRRGSPVLALAVRDDSGRCSPEELGEALRLSQEDLAASREELRAVNDELNASQEKLTGAAEELNRATLQLQDKAAEIEMLGRVLRSGDVAALFLDRELRVQWFTAATRHLFPLRPADAGRRITDLAPQFEDATFIADVHEVMRTREPYEGEIRNREGRWFLQRIHPYVLEDQSEGVAITFTDISDRRLAESELRRSEALHRAQNEAFHAAVNGAPLKTSLEMLVSAAIEQAGEGLRCAFYLADAAGLELHHVAGTFHAWGTQFGGFKVGPDSLACGLALFTGSPVITPDVTKESRWAQWLHLSSDLKFRGCWSFPLVTRAAKPIGTFAVYHSEPREGTPRELEFAAKLAAAAAGIISHHQDGERRADADAATRERQAELARELDNARERLRISTESTSTPRE